MKQRDIVVDALRGIAIMMVVLGHVLTGCIKEIESGLLYNIIWSLQMPLFFLISGYITRYGKKITDLKELLNYVIKRTVTYLVPFIMFSLVRGILFGEKYFLNIKNFLYHMDSGYWFLFVIWVITLLYGIAQYVAYKIVKQKTHILQEIVFFLSYMVGCCLLLFVGIQFGFSFLCVKLTIYYIPFYLLGYLYGKIKEIVDKSKRLTNIQDVLVAISVLVYIYIIMRYNGYFASSALEIAVRIVGSVTGCIFLCGTLSKIIQKNNKLKNALGYIGKISLEIYTIHYIVLGCLSSLYINLSNAWYTVLIYLLVLSITISMTTIVSQNKFLSMCLFGKLKNENYSN